MVETVTPICWSVSGLVHAVADALKARFAVVTVKGEISSFSRAASGHCYFTLKDANSQIRCAMFQRAANMLSFNPAQGDEVELQGRLAIYEQRGELQLIVETMRPVGQGRLLEQFQQLKRKLELEGLFDSTRKRPIPLYPRCIGVVSSLQAAALHDVLTALQRRAPHVRVIVYAASVQGAQSVKELVKAIVTASKRKEVDTLLVCRGGGSLEDLWSFNEEAVVRAVAACTVPVISGVGHETDFTLTDFVADLRAPTPTAAAELAAQPRHDVLKRVEQQAFYLTRQVHAQLEQTGQRIDRAVLSLRQPTAMLHTLQQRLEQAALQLRMSVKQSMAHKIQWVGDLQRRWPLYSRQVLQNKKTHLDQLFIRWQRQAPIHVMRDQHQQLEALALRYRWALDKQVALKHTQLDLYAQQLTAAVPRMTQQKLQHIQNLASRLEALNPSQVLARGYAWVSDEQGHVLSAANQLTPGQRIQAQFADGKAIAKVEQVIPDLLP